MKTVKHVKTKTDLSTLGNKIRLNIVVPVAVTWLLHLTDTSFSKSTNKTPETYKLIQTLRLFIPADQPQI